MKRIIVNNFSRGMADDRFGGGNGEFSFSKHFDTLSYPKRLQPLRGMTSDTSSTGIGNIIVASDGLMYGIGISSAGVGKLWVRSGYGGSDLWRAISTQNQTCSGIIYDFLVDWPDAWPATATQRTILWAGTDTLNVSQKDGVGSASVNNTALPFTTIGQGIVHPKDRRVYFTYKTATTHYIAVIAPNATDLAGLNATAFALPFAYRAYHTSYYGNYIAVPLTSVNGAGVDGSYVGLWNRDTSITTFDETITWGVGRLKVLNNLNGALIGVSESQAIYTGFNQDSDSIMIKVWDGGAEPVTIKEIKATHLAGSNQPSCSINPRVNFIHKNRLYFSINVVPNDGKQASYYGLWSVGKNKVTGEWSVQLERIATNTNTETGVIAAAIVGDFVSMAHTAEGTLTFSINGNTGNTTFAATSVYESLVNPDMDPADNLLKKKLYSISVSCQPLPTSAQLVLKYRVDSDGDTADWVTAYTFTTADGVHFEAPNAAGTAFTDGHNYEFRLESTGGATVTSFSYKYEVLQTNA
jgi:hypothetical protein